MVLELLYLKMELNTKMNEKKAKELFGLKINLFVL